jgi:hypothetical protein
MQANHLPLSGIIKQKPPFRDATLIYKYYNWNIHSNPPRSYPFTVHFSQNKFALSNLIMLYYRFFTLLASASFCQSRVTSGGPATCFPYGSAILPKDLSPPSVSPKEWRCPPSMAYGFQGFSYPLEEADCSAYSNSFESMNADFSQMKRDFGAKIVRLYYPLCLKASVFENALRAGVANNMAIIFQVWTDFGQSVSHGLCCNGDRFIDKSELRMIGRNRSKLYTTSWSRQSTGPLRRTWCTR